MKNVRTMLILKKLFCARNCPFSQSQSHYVQIKLHNRSMSSKLWNTISIQEVILQSMFSRIFTSYSEQERVNANGPNYATRYFVNEMSVAFYSCALTLPCGANSSILKNCVKIDHFSQSQSHNYISMDTSPDHITPAHA